MLKAAIALVPVFKKKLKRPELSLDDHYASAKFKFESIPGFLEAFREKESEIMEAMIQAQLSGQEDRNCDKQLKSWCQQLESI